jgi:Holliday junction resolvase RusA-like endonuclease
VKFRERAQFYIYTAVKAKTGNQGLLHPSGPVAIAVAAYFPCPKADCRKTKPRGLRWKPNGKDVDNCLKALMDAGTGILYRDDAQVVAASVRKFIAAQDEQPRTVLYVNEVKEGVFPPTDLGPNPPS